MKYSHSVLEPHLFISDMQKLKRQVIVTFPLQSLKCRISFPKLTENSVCQLSFSSMVVFSVTKSWPILMVNIWSPPMFLILRNSDLPVWSSPIVRKKARKNSYFYSHRYRYTWWWDEQQRDTVFQQFEMHIYNFLTLQTWLASADHQF